MRGILRQPIAIALIALFLLILVGSTVTIVPETRQGVIVRFGDPNMEIKRDDPKRRKAFRDRHNCDEKKDKTKYPSNYSQRRSPRDRWIKSDGS